ncbi:MAG TPA: hypothetical protein VHA82_01020 [Ramlibacter sp.]|uniref:hypothetical protein n=1 Tax=Ramlibacter sp. TaxID=1917967 RepID=UPI002B72AACB|nr:hypothetical protein [Ramlibacter sp.]HVZ42362.1 hypothetical protein [Ramlibacter sp.]
MHPEDKPTPRVLQPQQQQPAHDSDAGQQREGSTDFQSKPAGSSSEGGQGSQGGEVEGEGSYSATRDYQKNIKDYLDHADVKSDAEAAKPRSEEEAREMDEAEREGKSHSKGEH